MPRKLTEKQLAANRLNAKKGGRKKGTKNPATLEREKVLLAVNQQIMEQAAVLVRAGMIEAKGMNFVYRIDDVLNDKGKVIGKKHVRVTDSDEIARALDQMEAGGYDSENEYYYVTTKEPSMTAVDKLLNRPLGKAKEQLEITNPDGNLKTIIVNKFQGNAKK